MNVLQNGLRAPRGHVPHGGQVDTGRERLHQRPGPHLEKPRRRARSGSFSDVGGVGKVPRDDAPPQVRQGKPAGPSRAPAVRGVSHAEAPAAATLCRLERHVVPLVRPLSDIGRHNQHKVESRSGTELQAM